MQEAYFSKWNFPFIIILLLLEILHLLTISVDGLSHVALSFHMRPYGVVQLL